MGMFDEVIYEVDLRDRETGNSIETIYSGTDDAEAYGIADDWNAEHGLGRIQEDYESYDEIRFTKMNPTQTVFADVIHVEDPEEVHGIGKFERRKLNMNGLVHTSEGWEYQSNKRKYSLYEGMCLDSERNVTSDLCFIMDDKDLDKDEVFVGYVWGAEFIRNPNTRLDWDKAIGRIVERYEKRKNMPNGIARLEHARRCLKDYLNFFDDDSVEESELNKIKMDLVYLSKLIEKAKEMQDV